MVTNLTELKKNLSIAVNETVTKVRPQLKAEILAQIQQMNGNEPQNKNPGTNETTTKN